MRVELEVVRTRLDALQYKTLGRNSKVVTFLKAQTLENI